MLLFSDGADTASWLGAELIQAGKRTDVVVYPVGVRQRVDVFLSPTHKLASPLAAGTRST